MGFASLYPSYGAVRTDAGRDENVIRREALEPKSSTDHEIDARDSGLQSVDRVFSIIETLAVDDEGYRLSDLAIRTGLSTSTLLARPCGKWRRN